MTYKLKNNESISQGVKRIATEQIEKAIGEITTVDELGVDETVHQVRKRLKKIRALLRLVRDQLGKDMYKQENVYFRDLGRTLANVRDAQVRMETVDSLNSHFANRIQANTFIDIRQQLQISYNQEYQHIFDNNVLLSVQNQLAEARKRIDDWSISSDNWSTIDSSLKRVYKRGYKCLHKAKSEPSLENLHQWRKRVKYLRYQLRILRPIWADTINCLIAQTHDLSDYLGEDHDLGSLKEFMAQHLELFTSIDPHNLEIVISLINQRRQELQWLAIILGQRIYTESPPNFVNRLGAYWQIWQQEREKSLVSELATV